MSFGFSVGDFVTVLEKANKIWKQAAAATGQFKDISDEVQSFAYILKDIDNNWRWRLDEQRRTELNVILNGCRNVHAAAETTVQKFANLASATHSTTHWMEKAQNKVRKGWKKVQWDPQEIQYHRDRIVANLALLRTFRDNCAYQHELESRGEAVLDWISPTDHHSQQADNLKRQLEGTGQWIIECAEFKSWLSRKGSVLLCHGIPGAGKTTLASLIIDHLCQRHHNQPGIGIAYLYCDFRRQSEQSYTDLVASLLRQLWQVRRAVPDNITRLYDRHKTYPTRLSADQLSRELETVVSLFGGVFVIVDALDECCGAARASLLAELSGLCVKCGVRVLITSRSRKMLKEFSGHKSLEIRAKDSDIGKYLQTFMPSLLPGFVLDDTALQERILADTIKAVDGMFLLTRFSLTALAAAKSPKMMVEILGGLPTGSNAYKEAYDMIVTRIEKQASKQIARDVLALITFARRPLSIIELQHALAVEHGTLRLDQNNFTDVEQIVSACAGLVSVDEYSGIVRLVHRTAHEYLQQSQWLAGLEGNVGKACVNYLLFDTFGTGRCYTDEDFETRLELHPFYDYAACHWGMHVLAASIETDNVVPRLLQSDGNLMACSQVMLAQKGYTWRGYSQRAAEDVTATHIAAYFGLCEALAFILTRGVSSASMDSNGRTPLSWASEHGNEAVVRLLLNTGRVAVDCADQLGRTPLLWASVNGHKATVEALLNQGKAKIDWKDDDGRTGLSWASGNGHIGTVHLLIDSGGASVDAPDNFGRTPVSWAAEYGAETVLELLIHTKMVEKDSRDDAGRTPFSRAAECGHDDVLKLLLDSGGVEVDSRDLNHRTPLSWAAENGRQSTVKLLYDTGKIDINRRDKSGRTAISWAAGSGCNVVVQLLLNIDSVDIGSPDFLGHTPLHWAAESGNEPVVKLLVETQRIDTEVPDLKGRTAFSWAARNGHEAIISFLLKAVPCDINSRDANGRSAFLWAVGNGHEAVVRTLLSTDKVQVDTTDNCRRTPLSWAAESGHVAIVELLLTGARANPDSRDKDGRTPLSWAAESDQEAVIDLLINTGNVDVSSRDKLGRTPLLLAASEGCCPGVVKKLALESVVLVADYRGRTPLSCAEDGGNDEIVKLLRNKM